MVRPPGPVSRLLARPKTSERVEKDNDVLLGFNHAFRPLETEARETDVGIGSRVGSGGEDLGHAARTRLKCVTSSGRSSTSMSMRCASG